MLISLRYLSTVEMTVWISDFIQDNQL